MVFWWCPKENILFYRRCSLTITTHEDNVLDSKYNYQPQHFKFSKNIPDSTADNVFLNSYLLDFKQNFTTLHWVKSSPPLPIWPRTIWPDQLDLSAFQKPKYHLSKCSFDLVQTNRVKFNSYEQQPSQQSNPKLSEPLCGNLQYISESTGPFSFDLNPSEGNWCPI